MTVEVVSSFTEFRPEAPWERRLALACFRLRAEIADAACSIVASSASRSHAQGAIYVDMKESVGVGSSPAGA